MSPIDCTHDNFNFEKKPKLPAKKVVRTKLKPKHKPTVSPAVEEPDEIFTQDIAAEPLPNILQNYTIYINNAPNRNRLKAIAEGLGATVTPDINISTTHVVIEPKGDPKLLKLVKQSELKGIKCASPLWLIDCFETREYHSATYYPYAMIKDAHVLNFETEETKRIDDPFGSAFIDYDAEESRRANGGQTNLDAYITKMEVSSTPNDANVSYDDQDHDTIPYSPDILDEQEEMTREFYYNSNGEASNSSAPNSASLETEPETEQELQERKKQADERALKAKQVIQERMARLEKEPLRSKKTLQSGFGERLRIWYGEQAVRQEGSRRKRVVQSVLPQQSRMTSAATTTSASNRPPVQEQGKRPKY